MADARRNKRNTGTGSRKGKKTGNEKENTPAKALPRPKPTPSYKKSSQPQAAAADPVHEVSSDAEGPDVRVQDSEFNAAEALVGLAGGRQHGHTNPRNSAGSGPRASLKLKFTHSVIDRALGISEEEGMQLDEDEEGGGSEVEEDDGECCSWPRENFLMY